MPRRVNEVPLPWIRVDRSVEVPAERQIGSALRQAIRAGLLQRGFRLPSERRLAHDLGVSRRVVANAYARLESEGYVGATRGGATLVTAELAPRARTECAVAASSRARSMPPAPRGLLAPGSVALDQFPWRRWNAGAAGGGDLRELIATQVCPTRGIVASAEQIVLASGREEALACAARLLVDAGELVLVETPGDPRTRALYEQLGLRWRADRVDSEGLAFDATAEAPRLVHVTAGRHYPVGVQMSLGRQYLLLQWARSIGAAVVEEDRDGDTRALQPCDRDGRVVHVGSFDKMLFPGVGVAFLVVPSALASVAERLAPPPARAACDLLARFIARGELARHTGRLRPIYGERQDALTAELRRRLDGAIHGITTGAALDLVVWLAPHLDDAAIAAATGTVALNACAVSPGQFPPALIVGYGGVTPCDASVAVEELARAIDCADAERRPA